MEAAETEVVEDATIDAAVEDVMIDEVEKDVLTQEAIQVLEVTEDQVIDVQTLGIVLEIEVIDEVQTTRHNQDAQIQVLNQTILDFLDQDVADGNKFSC